MTQYTFFKMHGLGNDYIFLDGRHNDVPDPVKTASIWCNRYEGIGADGIVLILPSTTASVRMRIFNADGSEAQTCGNALRCIGKYLDDRHELTDGAFSIETVQRVVLGKIIERGKIRSVVAVDMGIPVWEPFKIPVHSDKDMVLREKFAIENAMEFNISCVSMGNPHCVIEVNDVHGFPVTKYGPLIENASYFPERTNVGFMEIKDKQHILLRVWERGSGETRACGSGACAAYAVHSRLQGTTLPMLIELPGGTLRLSFSDDGLSIIQEGTANNVYTGQIQL